MTAAFKCDSCGQFRILPESEEYDTESHISWTTVTENGKRVWHSIDLCEVCSAPVINSLSKIEETTHKS